MKRNLQKYPYILLAAGLLTLTGCGTSITIPAEEFQTQTTEESSDAADSAEDNDTTAENNVSENIDEADAENDTDVTSSASETVFSVSYETKTGETKADDGTVLFTTSVTIPTVSDGTANAAIDKINTDMKQFLTSTPTDTDTLAWAQEEYKASQTEDGMVFDAFTDDTSVTAKRLDENVISFEITSYSYSGGAHGNYGSVGRNYNAKTGELISYDDLSADPDRFLKQSGNYLADLAETPSYSVMLFPETSRDDVKSALLDDDKWILTESGITYISNPYVLAPFASGTIYFTLGYADAEDIGLSADYAYPGNFVLERLYTPSYDLEGNDITDSAEPEYSFDLNGDGKEEGISFYGSIYRESGSIMSLVIDGTQFGDVISEQVDLQNGYTDNTYVLYDLDPEDSYVELGVLYFSTTGPDPTYQTYFFRYTESGELTYVGMIDGYASQPDADFDTLR